MFENFFKPPHLKRFLVASAAAVTALLVYVSAEHFRVVPGTGALDQEAPAPAPLGDRSIAVVPLLDGGAGAATDGVVLDLIDSLVRVAEIEVIAARSALALPGIERPGPSQTALFQTAWVLEVRSAVEGDALRLGASLVQATENTPVWALEQLRPAGEVSAFIAEVMGALADRLGFQAPDWPGGRQGVDPAVYRDYQSARLMLTLGGSHGEQPRRLLEGVLEASPDFAPAHAAHAYSLLLQAAGAPEGVDELLQSALADLQTAEALQPELAEIYLYRSQIAHRFEWDWQGAYDAAQQALALAPGDAAVLVAASTAAFTLGRFAEGAEQLRRAIALDPVALGHRLKYGLMLEFSGEEKLAINAYRELMVIDPDFPGVHAYLGRTLVIAGRAEPALRHQEFEPSPFWSAYTTVLALQALGRDEEAGAELQDLMARHGYEAAVQIAEIHAHGGRIEEAFEWLQRATDQRDPGLASLLGNPLFAGLQDDPRWGALLEDLGLPAQ